MDANSLIALQSLIPMGGRSLLQYVSESNPWTTSKTQDALAHVQELAQEEITAVDKLIRFLRKKHVRPTVLGSYPSYFTTLNFMNLEYLMPKLIAENQLQIGVLEKRLAATSDDEAHGILQVYLAMKRRHLQTLQEAFTNVNHTPP
jgi:rubrerythrin